MAPTDQASLDEIETLPELFRWRVGKTPQQEAYREFDDSRNGWFGCSWHEIALKVEAWRQALEAEQFDPGERVAILMPNGVDHVSMDLAALSRGLVPVPLHAIDNPESIIYILQDSGASLLFVASTERWEMLAAGHSRLEALKRVVCARAPAGFKSSDSRVVTLDDWLRDDRARAAKGREIAVKANDLAAIVYTSGTTGRPKGVMLSHRNIIANVKAISKHLPVERDDIFLSFLPLSHTFERTAGYYQAIATGACVAYARSTQHLPEDLKVVRPTVIVSVPRIYERFYAKIIERRASASWLERTALELTLAVGGRRFDARQHLGPPPSLFDRLTWPFLKRIVADKILAQLGGRLRVAVSGGAPIAWPIARLFLSLGLDILQGYGMTETSPVVSANTPEDNDPRSVGKPLPGVEIRIGENRELLVRGPSVMVGYWRKPEETHRMIEGDGWLHTGDQARIENGRITITGRIKDIVVTSTGEKIAPADLETAIVSDPLFEQAMVVGEQRPYLAAIVVLNAEEWQREKVRLASADGTASAPNQQQSDFLLRRIAKAVKDFPAYATPRAIWWTTEPWTVDNGLLTPTLKIKRAPLQQRLSHQIEQLYSRKAPPEARPVTRAHIPSK